MSDRDPEATPYRAVVRGSWKCPRCDAGLAGEDHAGTRLEVCSRCGGMFAGHGVLGELITRDGALERLRTVLPREASSWAEGGRMYVACPACEVLMNRKQYATGARVVIDVCKQHGVWFDAGELPRVLDFVSSGGLELAARRDQERAKEVARREAAQREALKHDPLRDAPRRSTPLDLGVELGLLGLLDTLAGKLR